MTENIISLPGIMLTVMVACLAIGKCLKVLELWRCGLLSCRCLSLLHSSRRVCDYGTQSFPQGNSLSR